MRKLLSLLFSSLLAATTLVAISSPRAFAAPTLTTCTDLNTQKRVVLKANQKSCKPLHATAAWHIAQSDSPAHSGAGYASVRSCTSKRTQFDYQLLKSKCAKHQNTNDYWRTVAPLEIPIITTASARGYDSAAFALAGITQNIDAPIAYYLITNNKTGQFNKVSPNNAGELSLSNLSPLTSYTFTIAAVSVDGTSPPSSITPVITTSAVPVVVVVPATAPLAAPAFTLSSASETKTVNNAITGYTVTSSGGAIASYSISPTAPAGLTFSTSTGLLSGTPTSVASATAYTITATNASGSATQTFTLTVAIAAPAFTLSSSAETKTVNTAATGFTISSTGGAIASFAISATPAGMSFSTSTGALTGTPTSAASATAYTITATNASGSPTATFTLTVTAVVYTVGQTGPGGGKIFYVATTPFACGPARASTCIYLEAAPSGWNTGSDPARRWADSSYQSTTINNPTSPETATATAIGWGYRNTRAIVSQGNTDTATSAAALADAHTVTVSSVVYDDWYLPSKDELNQMCKWVRGVAWTSDATVCTGGTINTGSGAADFVAGGYWSSSEYNDVFAWLQGFNDGFQYGGNIYKNQTFYIRPVRAF